MLDAVPGVCVHFPSPGGIDVSGRIWNSTDHYLFISFETDVLVLFCTIFKQKYTFIYKHLHEKKNKSHPPIFFSGKLKKAVGRIMPSAKKSTKISKVSPFAMIDDDTTLHMLNGHESSCDAMERLRQRVAMFYV